MAFEIIIKPAAEISTTENTQIEEVDHLAYSAGDPNPSDEGDGIHWSDSEYYFLGVLDGCIVSLICLLTREVRAGEHSVRVAGVGGVATHPDFQRRGFAGLLLQRAAIFMREELEVPFGLLVCSPEREPYYRKFGWQAIQDPMIFETDQGKRTWTEVTMVLPLSDKPWPSGTVDLCGRPW